MIRTSIEKAHKPPKPMLIGYARVSTEDLRALSPLKWQHVNPYGTFTLNVCHWLRLCDTSLCRNFGLR